MDAADVTITATDITFDTQFDVPAEIAEKLNTFDDVLGWAKLKKDTWEAIAEQLAHPERYADERSVMRVYLEARRRRRRALIQRHRA